MGKRTNATERLQKIVWLFQRERRWLALYSLLPRAWYAHIAGYPSFAPLFERISPTEPPAFLSFLRFVEPKRPLILLHQAIQRSKSPQRETIKLLHGAMWREHLLGAMLILHGVRTEATLNRLWRTFDTDTWVTPQLAMTAYLCDSVFEKQARTRIEKRNVASPKALTSLLYALQQIPDAVTCVEAMQNEPDLRKMLEEDRWDQGDVLAEQWLTEVRKYPQLRGLPGR